MSTTEHPVMPQTELSFEAIYAEAGSVLDYHQLDQHIINGLRAILSSWKQDRGLHSQSNEEARFRVDTINRIRACMVINKTLADTPAIGEKPVVKPIFIAGLPRTGTTLLHRLLALDPNGRALRAWETHACPSPPPHPETHDQHPAIEKVQKGLDRFYEMNPGFRKVHSMSAREPEECNRLFLGQFHSLVEAANYRLPSFRKWILRQNMTPAYAFYKKILQIWSWHFPPQHWVLKAPLHLFNLEPLLEVFPDACVIQTHRHPLKVAPSYLSLRTAICKAYNSSVDPGEKMLGELLELTEAAQKSHRKKLKPDSFHHVSFKKLMTDPVEVIHNIYDRFNYAYTPEFENNMRDWIQKNRRDKHGKHRYDLTDYQLTEDHVLDAFSDYIQTWRDLI